jgi:hypothetical protein
MERIPAQRWGSPEDFEGVVVYLASRASDYVCGECVTVDGGWMASESGRTAAKKRRVGGTLMAWCFSRIQGKKPVESGGVVLVSLYGICANRDVIATGNRRSMRTRLLLFPDEGNMAELMVQPQGIFGKAVTCKWLYSVRST